MTGITVSRGVEIPEETKRRIESAKELLADLEAINEVHLDMPFWTRRIRRACKRNQTYVSNAWSLHGNISKRYMKHLSQRLGSGFNVDRTYYQDPLGIIEPKVIVSW